MKKCIHYKDVKIFSYEDIFTEGHFWSIEIQNVKKHDHRNFCIQS